MQINVVHYEPHTFLLWDPKLASFIFVCAVKCYKETSVLAGNACAINFGEQIYKRYYLWYQCMAVMFLLIVI